MKNLILTCSNLNTKALSLFVLLFVACLNLSGQTESVTINAPVDNSQYCAEQQSMVTFTATANDAGGGAVSSSLLNWNWEGPNGFTSSQSQPPLTIDDEAWDGDYMVTVSFPNGAMAFDTVTLVVNETVEIECPDPIIITPDLTGSMPSCDKDLIFSSFDVDAVNCAGPPYVYDITFVDEDGTTRLADDGNPVQGTVNNSTSTQTISPSNASYSTLPFGFHTLQIDINDPSTSMIVQQCLVEVQVLESINNLACNDLINVTMTDACEAIITPAMILQGEYCFDAFEIDMALVSDPSVTFEGISQVTINQIGLYNVTVTGQSGLSCWGQVLAEDKSLPDLDCDDVTIFCTEIGEAAPGSVIRGFDRGLAFNQTVTATGSGSGTLSIPFDLTEISGQITNMVLNFEAEIENASDLEILLQTPNGTAPVTLLDAGEFTESCDNSNINVCLSDAGALEYAMFGSPVHCRETLNALIGSFRPATAFSTFYSEDAENPSATFPNRFTLIVNNTSTSDPINIIEADLQVTTNEGTFLTSSGLVQSVGCDSAPVITFEDNEIGQPCENDLWTVIERTWVVTNQNSGRSEDCVQTINVKKFDLDEVIMPKSYDGLDQESLTCENATLDTGVPSLPFGRALEDCGNFQMTSSDLTFSICGPVASKTVRTFSLLDWCTGEIVEHDQVIKIEDNEPIVATCSPDDLAPADADFFENTLGIDLSAVDNMPYLTNTNPGSCIGDWDFVPPLTIDNPCNDDITFTLSYRLADPANPLSPDPFATYIDDNVVYDSNGYPERITGLPGNQFTWIRIEMEDECGNEGICFSEVYVRDNVRPNPVCVEFTVVALGDNGCGYLPAASVDNNSYDNCGVDGFLVRRLGTGTFSDQLELCCTDCANGPIMVELMVTDGSGNSNTCEAEVRLQDNIPIQMLSTPPANVTYNCEDSPIDLTAAIDAELARFDFSDNCGWDNTSSTVQLDPTSPTTLERGQCGAGSVTVKYNVTDNCGMPVPGSPFNQTFSFVNNSLTDPSQFAVTNWPDDLTLTQCLGLTGLNPEALDSPFNADAITYNTGACNDLAIGHDDLVFYNVDNACLKILRTWTVVDWCIANAPGNTLAQATRIHVQDIKIFDTEAPVVTVSSVSVSDSIGACSAPVELIATVADACTDMFGNQETTVTYTITYPDNTTTSGIGLDASGTYPLGSSTVAFVAEDHCGNVSDAFNATVTVLDAKAPTPYCRGSVVTATMSNAGSVAIWADDYDLGGEDACDNDLDVYFVRGGVESTSLDFDCSDIPNGVSTTIALEVHFRDDAGNSDFCIVTLLLQDNNSDVCDESGSRIAGNIHTELHENIEDVQVNLQSNVGDFNNFMMTQNDGNYAFEGLAINNNYSVTSGKEDHPLNGVSTIDIIVIQRHILGATQFTSPYKVIAADVNNDEEITALDLIELRKLILGITNNMPNGQTPWRFPNESQNFLDVLRPFPYTESIDVFNLNSVMLDQDFVGVKIGDVNGSVILNATEGNEVEKRSNRSLQLEVENQTLVSGTEVTIPVYASNMDDIAGFQNTLNFDASALTFVDVVAGQIDLTEDNVAMYNADNGSIAISWNDINGVSLDEDEVLFELVFDVNENSSLAKQLFLNSSMTQTEAYTSDLEILDMDLTFRGIEAQEFVLYQNVPNPFSNNTEIQFSLPGDSDVTFSVFDMNGREVMRQKNTYTAGNHKIALTKEQLNSTSIMYYQLESAYGTASKKMIQIR